MLSHVMVASSQAIMEHIYCTSQSLSSFLIPFQGNIWKFCSVPTIPLKYMIHKNLPIKAFLIPWMLMIFLPFQNQNSKSWSGRLSLAHGFRMLHSLLQLFNGMYRMASPWPHLLMGRNIWEGMQECQYYSPTPTSPHPFMMENSIFSPITNQLQILNLGRRFVFHNITKG